MSRFYFTSPASTPSRRSSAAGRDDSHTLTLDDPDDYDNLPYPLPIPRDPFLAPDFSPAGYLSSLNVRTRHQTLEDLRAELRTRSQELSKELLELVNGNYRDFLGLGGSLRGGEEKVEEVRVGLLGFKRGVEEVRGVVEERRGEVERLVSEREELWRERQVARGLIDVEGRIGQLEGRLMVESSGRGGSQEDGESEEDGEDDEDEDDELANGELQGAVMSTRKLREHVEQYQCLLEVMERLGLDHPFIKAQDHRVARIRNTILLDLSNALKQARSANEAGRGRLLKVMALYRELDEEKQAIRVLKSS